MWGQWWRMWMDWTFHNLTILARGKQLRYFNSTWQRFYIDSFIAANRDAPIYWRCEWLSESQKSVCKAPWAPSSGNLLNIWALQNVLDPPKPDSPPGQQSQTAQYSQTHPASSSVARIRLQRYNVQLAIYNVRWRILWKQYNIFGGGGCNQFISNTLFTSLCTTGYVYKYWCFCQSWPTVLKQKTQCARQAPLRQGGSLHNIW